MFLLYVKVNDIQMYHDIQGDGEPLEGILFNVDPPATEEASYTANMEGNNSSQH